MSSFAGAVRIGAGTRSFKVTDPMARAIADVAEDVAEELLTRVRNTTNAHLRDIVRNTLLRGRHESWYEAPVADEDWRESLLSGAADYFRTGRVWSPKLRLLNGGAL